jgi:hypothetical protein
MAIVIRRGLVIPVWAAALCAAALSAPLRLVPWIGAFLGIAVIASMLPAVLRLLRHDEAIDWHTLNSEDAADLVRMDDDGGWQMAGHAPRA